MTKNCRHCGEQMRKHHFDNPRWTYPERDWKWLCSNVDCILDRYSSCDLFGHEKTRNDSGELTCKKCDKIFERKL